MTSTELHRCGWVPLHRFKSSTLSCLFYKGAQSVETAVPLLTS